MIKFGNDVVTVGGDWLKYEEPVPPTPVVDDELQATPPSSHASTFNKCGRDTVSGAAELAQIPSDWK